MLLYLFLFSSPFSLQTQEGIYQTVINQWPCRMVRSLPMSLVTSHLRLRQQQVVATLFLRGIELIRTMKMYGIIITIFLVATFYKQGVCQTRLDERNVYEWRVQRPDTVAIKRNMKSYSITVIDARGRQTLAFEKRFNRAHFLTKMAIYDGDQPWSNPQMDVERWGKDSLKVVNRLNKNALSVFADTGLEHLIVIAARHNDSAYFTVESIYKLQKDTGINVITIVDGQNLGKVHFHSLLSPLPPPPVIVLHTDTTFRGDTMVVRSVDNNDTPFIGIKTFYILKGQTDPFRVETRGYQGDSLLWYSWESRSFDAKQRMTSHVICSRDGELYKLREHIVYNDSLREKDVFDNTASDPNQTNSNRVYHYKNGLCVQVDYPSGDKQGMYQQYFYTYYPNGLYKDITKMKFGKFEFKRVYHYTYYNQ